MHLFGHLHMVISMWETRVNGDNLRNGGLESDIMRKREMLGWQN
jgi:hypothetical protein